VKQVRCQIDPLRDEVSDTELGDGLGMAETWLKLKVEANSIGPASLVIAKDSLNTSAAASIGCNVWKFKA